MIFDLTYPDGDLKSENLRGGGVKKKGGGQEADLTFDLSLDLSLV